jgi:glycosyltransferase involved in cell wall biosynthesis
MDELPQTRRADSRANVCIVIAALQEDRHLDQCVQSVRQHTPGAKLTRVDPDTAAVNGALAQLSPADVVVLGAPCEVGDGWLERMRAAAHADTNTATASALADQASELALFESGPSEGDLERLSEQIAERALRLRPRITRAVGPCVYIRRDALGLVGGLDEGLHLRWALEIDFAQRCLLSGLAHVAADDVVVGQLAPAKRRDERAPAKLLERYPYLSPLPPLGESAVLGQALEAARGPRPRLSVTIDARALDGAITGTRVHILELIRALARTDELQLRLLLPLEQIDDETLARLRELPATEILAAETLNEDTPRSTVFHRPQQTFSSDDVALALSLGERFVLSQLDLIAYRNPGYFADAGAWGDYRRASRHGLSAAERVVVFSDHTSRELVSDALVDRQRIRIVAPGLDHSRTIDPRPPAALQEPETPARKGGYLLCLGTDFRHKNRLFALRMLAALRQRHSWNGHLVLAGTHIPHGSSRELERTFLRRNPELEQALVVLGPVSEQEKAWLVAHAVAVVYPSVYEGFGLVPFESALQGIPCVFAAQSSLAETAPSDTPTIVPWDAEASAAAAYPLLTDEHVRARHVQALADAARPLTWAATATAMVEIYREAAAAAVRDAATLSRDAVARERRLSVVHLAEARRLVEEREHARRMYDELNAEVGSGLALIGPNGTLPEGLQRALLALSAHPRIAGPLFAVTSGAFLAARGVARTIRSLLRPGR